MQTIDEKKWKARKILGIILGPSIFLLVLWFAKELNFIDAVLGDSFVKFVGLGAVASTLSLIVILKVTQKTKWVTWISRRIDEIVK